MSGKEEINGQTFHSENYVFENFDFSELNSSFIFRHCSELPATDTRGFYDLQVLNITLNEAVFHNFPGIMPPDFAEVRLRENSLVLSCSCKTVKSKLCRHQAQILYNLARREDLKVFFDTRLRHDKIRKVAPDYGLENEENPDLHFLLEYGHKSIEIRPRQEGLLPVNAKENKKLENLLLPAKTRPVNENTLKTVIIFAKHRYYDHLSVELYEGETGREGKLKNPVKPVDPYHRVWETDQKEEIKFYTAISKFQNNFNTEKSETDIECLKALVKNPLQLDVYYHKPDVSPHISASSITRVELSTLPVDIRLRVDLKNNFYQVAGCLMVYEKAYDLQNLDIRYHYFMMAANTLYLVDNTGLLHLVDFFKQRNNHVLIHESKFEEFRRDILSKLEDKITITYSFVKAATQKQLQESGYDSSTERIIYLSDTSNYVEITPVMRYANTEIPVLSRRQIYATDENGTAFSVKRDTDTEERFIAMLQRQHPDFKEQKDDHCFYLPKSSFMDENWFLDAFEEWRSQGISILGFNELKNNKLNPNKASVSVSILSGINWFDTSVNVRFGNQQVSLKHLHKSIRNKNRFVQLGDGTVGILPEEWMKKFSGYFQSGEIEDEKIRIPKINFSSIAEMYDEEAFTPDLKKEIEQYESKIASFETIQAVPVPAELKASLRDYQQQGLNWLNCLDDFGFGACLADDMGLGKTLQVLAFILSQREKTSKNTNLVVVPTSLIFNWQEEVAKFAPGIKVLTIYGPGRVKHHTEFDRYEIILTSYGTLQSDIRFIKDYHFNYIVLDESQAIKNPKSLRYKTVRLLQSRNKIVMTGTPIENNTFDIYGQLSFACPGLLGSQQYFKELYSDAIDKFKDSKRAAELQKKISPFILRRTKEQVASELPGKTEMIIYCEMGDEQREIYNRCEQEFRDFISSQSTEDVKKSSMFVLQGLTKLRQICNSPALIQDYAYQGNTSSKIDTLLEEIENKSPRHKILVFSQFVTMLDLVRKKLDEKNIGYEYLTGQTRNRAAKVASFQENEHIRVFLISLKAGGTGLNLTRADYVYLVDPWWNPAVENQAIDRSYRIGQKNNVVAVRLICPNTIESKMMELQKSKKELVSNLVKTDTSVFKTLTKKDLLNLLR